MSPGLFSGKGYLPWCVCFSDLIVSFLGTKSNEVKLCAAIFACFACEGPQVFMADSRVIHHYFVGYDYFLSRKGF